MFWIQLIHCPPKMKMAYSFNHFFFSYNFPDRNVYSLKMGILYISTTPYPLDHYSVVLKSENVYRVVEHSKILTLVQHLFIIVECRIIQGGGMTFWKRAKTFRGVLMISLSQLHFVDC